MAAEEAADDIAARIKLNDEMRAAQVAMLLRRVEFQPARYADDVETKLRFPPRVLCRQMSKSEASRGEKDERSQEKAVPLSRYLFPPEQLEPLLRWQSFSGVGAGLANLGNTCFLNAVLQCLTYTPPFANFCLKQLHSRGCRADGFCLFCEVERHVREAHGGRRRTLAPRAIASRIRAVGKQFRLGKQQDAHEFFLCLLDRLQAAALPPAGASGPLPPEVSATSALSQIFGGTLVSQLTCGGCGHLSSTFEYFLDLSLELKRAKYTSTELLEGDNQYQCPRCARLVDARKQLRVQRSPHVLVLQLKRFGFEGRGGGKISRMIEYDEALDLARFTTTGASERYRLFAVLVHDGCSIHAGHYYCHVRAASGVWHTLEDDTVRQVSAQRVLRECAYLLFYERVQPANEVQPAGGEPCKPSGGSAVAAPSDEDEGSVISAASAEPRPRARLLRPRSVPRTAEGSGRPAAHIRKRRRVPCLSLLAFRPAATVWWRVNSQLFSKGPLHAAKSSASSICAAALPVPSKDACHPPAAPDDAGALQAVGIPGVPDASPPPASSLALASCVNERARGTTRPATPKLAQNMGRPFREVDVWEDLPRELLTPAVSAEGTKMRQRSSYDYFDAYFDRGHVKKVKNKETDDSLKNRTSRPQRAFADGVKNRSKKKR